MKLNQAALKTFRTMRGMSQPELARKCKIGQSHLANLEAGRRQASDDLIRRLAAKLDVPVEAILADYHLNIRKAS